MARLQAGLGLAGGVLLLLSSAAHSLLGGKAIQQELTDARVPESLRFGAMVGWHFGGAAMLAFGIIMLVLFSRRFRGAGDSTFPALVIGGVYLAFGGWALVASGFRPFFILFVVQGALLVAAAAGRSGRPEGA